LGYVDNLIANLKRKKEICFKVEYLKNDFLSFAGYLRKNPAKIFKKPLSCRPGTIVVIP
jgi:hypothetical protein